LRLPKAREKLRRFGLVARLGKHCRELGKGELNASSEFSNDRSTLAALRRNHSLTWCFAKSRLQDGFRHWKPNKQKSEEPE
jgi:hypothetical protein